MLGELLTGGTVDLSSFEETYLEPIAPGASLDDINALLDTAYDCLGLKLIGYDPANPDPGIAALIEGLENGRLPESLSIPAGFGVELNYNYTMKKVQSANGTVYDAVYLTPYDGDTQPFIVMTMGSKTYDMNPNVAPDDPSAEYYKTDGPKTARVSREASKQKKRGAVCSALFYADLVSYNALRGSPPLFALSASRRGICRRNSLPFSFGRLAGARACPRRAADGNPPL